MFSKQVMLAVGAVGAALFMSATAKAVTLDQLTGSNFGAQIVVGNVVYSNFSYGGTTPVSSVVVNSDPTGLQFTTNTAGWSTPSGSSIISYDINVTGSSIQTVNLGFTATATGNAVASVGETVTDKVSKKDYSLQVSASGNSKLPSNNTDSVTLNPTSNSLHIIKSIDVASTARVGDDHASGQHLHSERRRQPATGSGAHDTRASASRSRRPGASQEVCPIISVLCDPYGGGPSACRRPASFLDSSGTMG